MKPNRNTDSEKERLRTILQSIGDTVIATDLQGNIRQVNLVAERLTGWSAAEALGKKLDEVFRIVDARTRRSAENPVGKVLRSGETVGLANHTVLIARDGKEYQIADSGSPIRAADGTITGVVLAFKDVTEEYRIGKPEGGLRWVRETGQVLFREDAGSRTPEQVIGVVMDTTKRQEHEEALRESAERFSPLPTTFPSLPGWPTAEEIFSGTTGAGTSTRVQRPRKSVPGVGRPCTTPIIYPG